MLTTLHSKVNTLLNAILTEALDLKVHPNTQFRTQPWCFIPAVRMTDRNRSVGTTMFYKIFLMRSRFLSKEIPNNTCKHCKTSYTSKEVSAMQLLQKGKAVLKKNLALQGMFTPRKQQER